MRKDYFEGTLQLRDCPARVMEFVYRHIENHEHLNIAKHSVLKTGEDFYLSSQKYMVQLGKLLERKFPGKTTITRKLHTFNHQTSKPVYRVTVLFRAYPFKEKSKVNYKGTEYVVQRISQKVHLKDLSTGKRISVDYKELK